MMSSVMLTATQARAKAQQDLVIFNEVRNIELAVLTAISNGNYQAELTTTAMTDTGNGVIAARQYFNSWQGLSSDRSKDIQMTAVITYFSNLGYNIERRTNPLTGDTFKWLIYW